MDQVGNLLDRPRHYYNIDGLGELSCSALLLGSALLLSLSARSSAGSVWHQISGVGYLGLILVIHYGTKAIKAHITYPRTGFVEYRKSQRRRTSIITAVLGALMALGLTVALRRRWDITTPAALYGLLVAAVYAYRIARAVHWKWAVVCAIALGSIVIAFLPADFLAALANDSPTSARVWGTILTSFMTYGAILLVSGAISFWLYLRHTQAPSQEGQ